MKCLKKVFCIVTVVCVLWSVSVTAFADHTRISDLSEDEAFDKVWQSVVSSCFSRNDLKKAIINGDMNDLFEISIYYYEFQKFMKDYEPIGDDDVADVDRNFLEKLNSDYSDIDMKFEKDYVIFKSNETGKTTWTYDKSKDGYVNKDENGKTIKSIARYHLPDEEEILSQNSSENKETDSVGTSEYNDSPVSADDGSGQNDSRDYQLKTADNDSAAVSAKDEEEPSEESSAADTVLVVIGGLIVVGLGVVGYLLMKRKKENGNGK